MRRVADTGPGALTSSRHPVEHLAAVAKLPRKCPHRLLPSPTIGAEQRAGWHAATQGRGSAKGTGPVFTRSHGRASLPNVQHSGLARGGSAPFDPPEVRAPAEFAGRGLAPRPSCRCVLSRAPHEGHMAAGSCWGRLRGRGLGEAARGLVGQINGELAEDTRAESALRTALQAHRGKPGNVDPKALAA